MTVLTRNGLNRRRSSAEIPSPAMADCEGSRRGSRRAPSQPARCGWASCLFDMLSDDAILLVAAELMAIQRPNSPCQMEYLSQAEAGRRSAVALGITCKRLLAVIKNNSSPQAVELRARAATKIMPRHAGSALAFSDQVGREARSRDQLRVLREAQRAMACHCAKACCLNIQKAFNRDLARGKPVGAGAAAAKRPVSGRLVPVLESCSLLAASSNGSSGFAYRRKRVSKTGCHGEGRGKRYEDEILRIELRTGSQKGAEAKEVSRVLVEQDDRSSPLFMRSSADGRWAVWICATHEVDADQEVPFSCAFAWDSSCSASCVLRPPDGCAPELLSAQDAWFMEEGDKTLVVVAWSTDFFHPSGHHVGSWANPGRESYLFATYSLVDGAAELCSEGLLHEDSCLISCSPTRSGNEALALVKREGGYSPRHRYTVLHDVCTECTSRIPHNVPSEKGPVCAAISPMGDCVVAMHKTERSLMVNVQVRTSVSGFTPVQKLDLSPWIALCPWKEPDMLSDLVKASFCVRFSPCGRFFYVQDTRPLFGEKAAAHGMVVVDMALRMERAQSLRAFPMFPTDEQAPRSAEWTDAGFWLMPPGTDSNGSIGARGGALCLLSACSTG